LLELSQGLNVALNPPMEQENAKGQAYHHHDGRRQQPNGSGVEVRHKPSESADIRNEQNS
jgi:hypothetical protein